MPVGLCETGNRNQGTASTRSSHHAQKCKSVFRKSTAAIKQAKRERRTKRKPETEQVFELLENTDSDETFAFIAGYTPARFPYGVA